MSYFDDFANHIIDTEFYAQGKEDQFKQDLEALKREIIGIVLSYGSISSKRIYNEVMREIYHKIRTFFNNYREEAEHDMKEQSNNEAKFLKELLKAAFGISVASSLSSQKIIDSPFNESDNLESFVLTTEDSLYKSVSTPLINSFVFGSSTSSVKESVEAGVDKVIRQSSSNVHTLVSSVQRNTEELMLLDDINFKYQYVSMLDESTCLKCGKNSGNIFDSLKDAPKLPVHNRCRCYYIPVIDKLDNPTYEQWLSEQPDSTQYKILGRTRYFLYKGGMKITKFTSDGHILSLEELFSDF